VKLRDFPKGSILYILRRAIYKFGANGASDMAAALTYFTVLSIFPALLAIVSLLGVFGHGEESAAVILAFLKDNAPAQMYAILEDPIKQITGDHGAGLVLLTGILSALWSASGYTGSFGRALNTVYNVREGRPGWILKPLNVFVTTVIIILVVLMMLMMLLGVTVLDMVGRYVPETVDMELIKLIWLNGRWVLILFMAIALITRASLRTVETLRRCGAGPLRHGSGRIRLHPLRQQLQQVQRHLRPHWWCDRDAAVHLDYEQYASLRCAPGRRNHAHAPDYRWR